MNEQEFYSELVSKMDVTDRKNNLALGAISETLTKMNDHLEKQEQEHEEEELERAHDLEKAQANESKSALIKEISTAVFEVLKMENMELNADKMRSVSHKEIFTENGGDEDKQVDAEDTNDTSKIQQPLQAMVKSEVVAVMKHFLKEHEALYGHDDVKDDVMTEDAEEELEMDMDIPELEEASQDIPMGGSDDAGGEGERDSFEGSAEYPMEEDDYEKMYKSIKKAYIKLKKGSPKSNGVDFEKAVSARSEATLKKQGWNKEISKQPRLINESTMGLDDIVLNKSANNGDVAEQLSSMSWKELTHLRARRDSGQHDGLPREIIGG